MSPAVARPRPTAAASRAGEIEAARSRLGGALGNPSGDDGHRGREGEAHQEDPPPRESAHQPPADQGAGRPGDGGQPRPGTDRSGPILRIDRCGEKRQAAGNQEGGGRALQGPGDHEGADVRREAAQQRGGAEPVHAEQEHPAPAVAIAEQPAQQHQGREGDQVGIHDPLQTRHVRAEVITDAGQGDVDDGGVEEGDARSEDRREHHTTSDGRSPGRRLHGGHRLSIDQPVRYRAIAWAMAWAIRARPPSLSRTAASVALRMLAHSMKTLGTVERFSPPRSVRVSYPLVPM